MRRMYRHIESQSQHEDFGQDTQGIVLPVVLSGEVVEVEDSVPPAPVVLAGDVAESDCDSVATTVNLGQNSEGVVAAPVLHDVVGPDDDHDVSGVGTPEMDSDSDSDWMESTEMDSDSEDPHGEAEEDTQQDTQKVVENEGEDTQKVVEDKEEDNQNVAENKEEDTQEVVDNKEEDNQKVAANKREDMQSLVEHIQNEEQSISERWLSKEQQKEALRLQKHLEYEEESHMKAFEAAQKIQEKNRRRRRREETVKLIQRRAVVAMGAEAASKCFEGWYEIRDMYAQRLRQEVLDGTLSTSEQRDKRRSEMEDAIAESRRRKMHSTGWYVDRNDHWVRLEQESR